MSIQMELFAAFGVVVALMVLLGLFAVVRLGAGNSHLRQLGSVVVPSTRAVGDINALMNKYRKDQLHYILAKPADRPLSAPGSIDGDLSNDLTQMRNDLRGYQTTRLIEDPVDARLFNTFRSDFYRYVTITSAFRPLADRGLTQPAGEVVGAGPGDHEWDTLKSVTAAWNNHKVAAASETSAKSRASYREGVRLIVALLALAVMLAVCIAVVLARRTTRAVREVGAAAKAISQGDIDQRVPVRGGDELGQMAADFDGMIDYLRSTVTIAETIAAGNLDVEITPRSGRDALGAALEQMTDSLRRVSSENQRLLAQTRQEADTDALTSLPNRRALMRDLDTQLGDQDRKITLALFDLDGFKEYNDTFGHLAGDALLARMGDRLQQTIAGCATAYRMGGDEFCVLAPADEHAGAAIAARAASALREKGEAFAIGCSYGIACLPKDASRTTDALSVADDRMYEHKTSRVSASRQSTDVLLKVLNERTPGLIEHAKEVATLAGMAAHRLGLSEAEIKRTKVAAELHDIGKAAIPDTILKKPGPLDEEEWAFMRRHTLIGERIINAAPCLVRAAELVRSSHERHDGRGYPDQLAGDEIPLGASIIAVCDAFDAMTSTRPYSEPMAITDALAELRGCSGSQFHPDVVQAFCALIEQRAALQLQAA
ncbi:MAG: HD domain-containing phosphohydrolase [Solirubrobacteraceae bacterium]